MLFLGFTLLVLRPCLCYRHQFNSRDAVARSVIETCRGQKFNETVGCFRMLRCIMDDIPSDFLARWSAGASILAFIPTIVALMSNSIHEITSIADESVVLAFALSMTSVTAFNSRFGYRPKRWSDAILEEQRWGHPRPETALPVLEGLIAQSRRSGPLWQNSQMQIYTLSIVAVALGAVIWYEVYEITKYGVVVFACPVKVNVGIWVGLSQLLALLNVLCRSFLSDIHTIHIRSGHPSPRRHSLAPLTHPDRFSIVLRCPRDTRLRWLLQSMTEILSFSLYAYGTVLLASMTLIPASDAIRAMVVSTVSAGFGRAVGYWFTSARKRVGQILVIDVPVNSLPDFTASVSNYAEINS